MLRFFARTDKSPIAQWWWTVDRWLVASVVILIGLGYLMAFAASPAVAQHIGKPIYYFANKQLVFLTLALGVFLAVSMLSPRLVRYLALVSFIAALVGVVATLFIGTSAKGASRWLMIAGVSVQPSEILKPAFVVVTAQLFAYHKTRFDAYALICAFALLVLCCVLLAGQPDIGQLTLMGLVWMCMYFLAGGSLRLLSVLGVLGIVAGAYLYATQPHVTSRVDRFITPSSGDTYQVDKAMDAIKSGGIVGVGPGDGRVKSILPDAHSDYVFAVAAEEGGLLIGSFIICVFAAIVLRALTRLKTEREHWIQLAAAGLTCLFGLQAIINLAVNLNLMPSKGMTLPFISYGGSSLLASALTMGMLVALSRRRSHSQMMARPISGVTLQAQFGGRA